MGKQKVLFAILCTLVCSVLVISGCTQQGPSTKESIQDILAKATSVGPVYYEIIGTTSTTAGGYSFNSSYSSKVWQKTPYMKIETTTGGINQIIVFRPDGSYMYNNQTQNYTKFLPPNNQTQQKFLEQQANEMIESQTLKVLGTDTIDGKVVTIVEYSYNASGMTFSPKVWIWNEKGIPLKMETKSTMMGVNMTMTMEYKNFVFGDIPDSIFNVSK